MVHTKYVLTFWINHRRSALKSLITSGLPQLAHSSCTPGIPFTSKINMWPVCWLVSIHPRWSELAYNKQSQTPAYWIRFGWTPRLLIPICLQCFQVQFCVPVDAKLAVTSLEFFHRLHRVHSRKSSVWHEKAVEWASFNWRVRASLRLRANLQRNCLAWTNPVNSMFKQFVLGQHQTEYWHVQ